MAVNSSFYVNASLLPPFSSSISIFCYLYKCYSSYGAFSLTAFTITSILLLLPLYILVLYLGLQRWQQQRSNMAVSHTDFITYHMVCFELISVMGFTLLCCGVHLDLSHISVLGIFLTCINLYGQMLFHLLTCVERYLAVVHPITYLSFRSAKGIRIRNIVIGCGWLLCFVSGNHLFLDFNTTTVIYYFCTTVFLLTLITLCSLHVLCVLIRPGPGERGGDRQRVDQSKLRAFYTIMVILGTLLVRFGGSVVTATQYFSPQVGDAVGCGLWLAVPWFCLPSSLVLPLLFLQRACCKKNNTSGQRSNQNS